MLMGDRNYQVDQICEPPDFQPIPKAQTQSYALDQHFGAVESDRGSQGNERLLMGTKALSPAGVVASTHRCGFLT